MTDLTQIPGIGKKMAQHLANVGYPDIESLKGQEAEEIYAKHQILYGVGNQSCRCVLYCYRLAVCYANNNGELLLLPNENGQKLTDKVPHFRREACPDINILRLFYNRLDGKNACNLTPLYLGVQKSGFLVRFA